jgi:hypothetical protein
MLHAAFRVDALKNGVVGDPLVRRRSDSIFKQ